MKWAFVFWAVLPAILYGQSRANLDTARVIAALFSGDTGAMLCFEDSTLTLSHRLGITYEGVSHKCLISYDLDESLKTRLRNKQLGYSTTLRSSDTEFDRLTLTIPSLGISRDFFFRNGCLVFPFFPLTAGWTTRSSRFFSFVMSDSTYTNPSAIEALDDFVLHAGEALGLSVADFATLEVRKIVYYLCKNEEEIHRLTGFSTRGMYNLAFDAIVSTYNAHLHELTHLLVNFTLRRNKLFAHPFLQEGLAVALGGRGGLSADVVAQLGAFLDESQMLQYSNLLRRSDFNSYDPSLSYPAAGLYNRFLLEALGCEGYFALYRRHCGTPGDSSLESISMTELPAQAEWAQYLNRWKARRAIQCEALDSTDRLLWRSEKSALHERQDRVLFSIRRALLFGSGDTTHTWCSNKFSELFAGSRYPGHRYAAIADSQSVSIYDLWTNTLIAGYNASFDLQPVTVPRWQSQYVFSVRKSLFSGPLIDPGCCPTEAATRQ
jgi:hypothetical protein